MSASLQSHLDKLADALAAGRITLDEWRLAVEHELPANAHAAIERLAQQYAADTLDAAALKQQVDALAAPQSNVADTAGQIALAAGTLALFRSLFKKARDGTAVNIPRVDSEVFAKYADFYQQRADALGSALSDGRISLEEWHLAMANEIADLHSTAYAAGKGGFGNLDSQDFANINAKALEQQKYLNAWVAQLRSGELPSEAALQARARMYVSAANSSLQRGMTEAIGLPELPAYPADGTTECRVNDKCEWRIVKLEGDGNFDAFWELNPAEHCETCLQRSVVWNPLKIRAGRILDYPDTGLYAA